MQPAQVADGAVLISTADAMGANGMRLLAVAHRPGGWAAEERWTSNGLKPYFNDFVVHKGHAFGFDGSILACIDLADGKRKWKGGRYGNGQLVLLPDQNLLIVLSEEGEVALVGAKPDQFTGARPVPGTRRQDLEPPGTCRRRAAGSQWPGDGRVPAVARGSLTCARRAHAHAVLASVLHVLRPVRRVQIPVLRHLHVRCEFARERSCSGKLGTRPLTGFL